MSRHHLALIGFLAFAGCHQKVSPSNEAFHDGLVAYLQKRGDLCLAKTSWPIDLSDRDIELRARDAVQLPVLERLGLVTSATVATKVQTEDGPVVAPMKRYQLTEAGQRYFRHRDGVSDDFCAAKLSLDKVVGWELSKTDPDHASVRYTYNVEPAPWTSDPEVQRVFPAVDRVIRGAGKAELREGFTLTEDGWVANELLPPAAATKVASRP